MKSVVAILVLSALLGVALSTTTKFTDNSVLAFKGFMMKYQKTYKSSEMSERFNIFKSNLATIEDLNARSKSARFGVTKYSDLSPEEFKALFLGTKPFKPQADWPMLPSVSATDAPVSWDWTTYKTPVVTPVKNQGQCGSCWSFSTTGNVEGQWALAGNTLVGLSEQNLVDCDHECMQYEGESVCDQGCDGGLMPNAYTYIIKNGGIDTEASYPYTAMDGTCSFNQANIGATIKNWTMIAGKEVDMVNGLYKYGPLSIAVDATYWQFYIEGIFDFPWCGDTLDHGVLIVGYGNGTDFLDETTNFWKIKNSWGADWGEDGYIRLIRGDAQCGVNLFPCTSLTGATA